MPAVRRFLTRTLQDRKAQLLLPAVLLLPIFILMVYLLVETTKLSIAKVRHQFALDNSAYTQTTAVSVFLNAVGLLNGPLPYRVLLTYNEPLKLVDPNNKYRDYDKWTVFDLFFQAGAVPTLASDYERGHNPPPKQESTDWGVHYVKHSNWTVDGENEEKMYSREGWEKEDPDAIKDPVILMNKMMVDKHYVAASKVGVPAINAYLTTALQVGDTYNLQKHLYETTIKNAVIFRKGYFLNVDDCKKDSCARQSASRLDRYLSIPTKRHEAKDIQVFVSASDLAGGSGGAIQIDLNTNQLEIDPVFFFAYVEPTGRSRLKTFKRGIMLKQSFPLPRNHFNINLGNKYKPYVRNTVFMSCPRGNNNCVWPNPLPKYNVYLRP